MDTVNITVPQVGESVTEVTLVSWRVKDGDVVEEGLPICEIESDKANLEVPAQASGTIAIVAQEGSELRVGALMATITPGRDAPSKKVPDHRVPPRGEGPRVPCPGPRPSLPFGQENLGRKGHRCNRDQGLRPWRAHHQGRCPRRPLKTRHLPQRPPRPSP